MKHVPVVEQSHRGERGWDIFSRLLRDRVVDELVSAKRPAKTP